MLARPAAPLATSVQRISSVDKTNKMRNSVNETNKNWLPWQRYLRDRNTNFRLIVYSHGSTNRENLAKIGVVDVEIIGLKEIFKK